jgi:hypothetical protein
MQLASGRRSFLQHTGAVAAFVTTTCEVVRNIAPAETTRGDAYWALGWPLEAPREGHR